MVDECFKKLPEPGKEKYMIPELFDLEVMIFL